MASPRTSITWTPQAHATLTRLSRLNGTSISSIVRDLVSAVEPDLRRAADLGEQSQRVSAEARETLARAAHDADALLMPSLQGAYRAYQAALAQLEEAATAAEASREEPPASNTGVVR